MGRGGNRTTEATEEHRGYLTAPVSQYASDRCAARLRRGLAVSLPPHPNQSVPSESSVVQTNRRRGLADSLPLHPNLSEPSV